MEGVFIMNKKWDIEKIKRFVESETDCELISNEYNGYTVPLKFTCSCGNEFKKTWNKFKSCEQRQCTDCALSNTIAKQKKNKCLFVNQATKLVGDEYEFLEEYNGAKVKIKVRHNICGNEYYVTPDSFLNKNRRCPHCQGGSNLGAKSFKEKLLELYSGEIELIGDFGKMHEITTFRNTVYDIEFSAYPTNVIQGYSLGRKISYGEHEIKTWFEEKAILFEFQFVFPELKRRPFDFYIPSKNTAIEFDGEQHFRPVEYFGGENKYNRQLKSDKLKTDYCQKNKINLIRIPYWKIDEINTILEDAIL